jgi:hypothetical protein
MSTNAVPTVGGFYYARQQWDGKVGIYLVLDHARPEDYAHLDVEWLGPIPEWRETPRAMLSQGLTDDNGNMAWWPESDGVWGYEERASGGLVAEVLILVRECGVNVEGRGEFIAVKALDGDPHGPVEVVGSKWRSVRELKAGAWIRYRGLQDDDPVIPGA